MNKDKNISRSSVVRHVAIESKARAIRDVSERVATALDAWGYSQHSHADRVKAVELAAKALHDD